LHAELNDRPVVPNVNPQTESPVFRTCIRAPILSLRKESITARARRRSEIRGTDLAYMPIHGLPFRRRSVSMMIKRILAPVDFSEPSRRALEYAADLSRTLGSQLIVLHVVEPVYYPVAGDLYGVGLDLGNVYEQIDRSAREQLAELARELRRRRVNVQAVLLHGTAPQAIVENATKSHADLVVMATHGRSGLSHLLLGSVANRVLRTAPCPVLTVSPRRSGSVGKASAAPARRRRAQAAARSRPRSAGRHAANGRR
jgi:nucleotide-binding universal stress UspA family protein